MKLGYIILYVESVPDTLAFYNSAFSLPTRFCVPDSTYAELAIPGSSTTLAFAAESFVESNIGTKVFRRNRAVSDDEDIRSPGAEISFVVDKDKGETVEGALEKALAAGAGLVKKAATKPWGQVVAYVRDCNGFLVEICTPVGGSGED